MYQPLNAIQIEIVKLKVWLIDDRIKKLFISFILECVICSKCLDTLSKSSSCISAYLLTCFLWIIHMLHCVNIPRLLHFFTIKQFMTYENIHAYALVEFYEDTMISRLFFLMTYKLNFPLFTVWNVSFLFIHVIFNEWVMYNFMYSTTIGALVPD